MKCSRINDFHYCFFIYAVWHAWMCSESHCSAQRLTQVWIDCQSHLYLPAFQDVYFVQKGFFSELRQNSLGWSVVYFFVSISTCSSTLPTFLIGLNCFFSHANITGDESFGVMNEGGDRARWFRWKLQCWKGHVYISVCNAVCHSEKKQLNYWGTWEECTVFYHVRENEKIIMLIWSVVSWRYSAMRPKISVNTS